MMQVYLVSCVKSKQTAATSCRAEDMYISPLYRASLMYASNRAEDKEKQVFILSALYGLLSLNDVISIYEKTLGKMPRAEIVEWGKLVDEKLSALFDIENTNFVFLAGEKYVAPLRKYLRHYSEPLKGIASIGGRIRWLKQNAPMNDTYSQSEIDLQPPLSSIYKPKSKPKQNNFSQALENAKAKALENGASSLTITSGELHRMVGGYPGTGHRMPMCCEAMYSAMLPGDIIVSKPPSGKGASVKITYHLKCDENALTDNKFIVSKPLKPVTESPMVSVWARELRSTEILKRIPDDKPGWYRWWAPTDVLEKLLNSPYIANKYMAQLSSHFLKRKFNDDYYFCVYVGVAIKESIRDRLNWHVNQRHTKSAVQSGFLSTFRKTISSLVAGNQYDEATTNELINNLIIEYCAIDCSIKSETAKNVIDKIERDELAKNILPLNIMGNCHIILQPFLADLKKARKQSSHHDFQE